jgi:HEAT repeat protein
LDSVTISDSLLRLAYWTCVAAMLMVGIMLSTITGLRAALILRERLEARVRARWRPILARSMSGLPQTLPRIGRFDRYLLLYLWNTLHESLRGEVKLELNKLALAAGLDAIARTLLARRRLRDRLIALSTLGHLQDRTRWQEIQALAHDDHPVLSIVAARALVIIDKSLALPLLMPLVVTRSDWPVARVASMLKEAGSDAVSGPLLQALANADAAQLQRLVSFLRLIHTDQAAAAVRAILAAHDDPSLIAACLKVIADPRDLVVVREHADHPNWIVRVAVAHALARMGRNDDVGTLLKLLADRQWWVRYRAAQALTSLPFLNKEELAHVASNLTDRFARDMLEQVMVEGQGARRSRAP